MLSRVIQLGLGLFGAVLFLQTGAALKGYWLGAIAESMGLWYYGLFALAGLVIGLALARPASLRIGQAMGWLVATLHRAPVADLIAGSVGLLVGLLIALLAAAPIPRGIPVVGDYIPVLITLFFGYVGASVAVRKRDDLVALFTRAGRSSDRADRADRAHRAERADRADRADRGEPPERPERGERTGAAARQGREAAGSLNGRQRPSPGGPVLAAPKVLDTSAIIDGRIADVCVAGFVEGTIVVPGFVIQELQRVADSSDPLKRNRGRRGLDILNELRKQAGVSVVIDDGAVEDPPGGDVDLMLVRYAKRVGGRVVTSDFNLNKVAELHEVPVLNVNELANALKPMVLPGEEMVVHVLRDGKEHGQGVGYLDDGTMIVVEGGRKYIGDSVDVTVTSVLQTSAGRMIFARPKAAERMV